MFLSDSERQLRRVAAEILALAVFELFPTVKLVGGGATRCGFGYHFVFDQNPMEAELECIQQAMGRIVRESRPISRLEMMRQNAAEMLRYTGQPLRAERVLAEGSSLLVDVFEVGQFRDVAKGPFPSDTSLLKSFELLTIEPEPEGGLFIGGIAFHSSQDLKHHKKIQKQAKKQDHRKLGPELKLFCSGGKAGAGLWLWQPQGVIIREALLNWWADEMKTLGCRLVSTPAIYRRDYLEFLGVSPIHEVLDQYGVTDGPFIGHALLAAAQFCSYRQLPLAYYEASAHLVWPDRAEHGLGRAREKLVDGASIFCEPERVSQTLFLLLQFISHGLNMLGFESQVRFCAHAPYVRGSRQQWGVAERQMVQVAQDLGLTWEQVPSDTGASGPSLELVIKDSIGRWWPGPAVQSELHLPEKLDLRYQSPSGQALRLAMVKCSVFGSLERFIALLVEHFAGHFPLWLAPEQVRVIPVGLGHRAYAMDLFDRLRSQNVRTSLDDRFENLANRVRLAQLSKVPYTVVIGDGEVKKDRVAVRSSLHREVRQCATGDWLVELKQEIETKALGGRIPRN